MLSSTAAASPLADRRLQLLAMPAAALVCGYAAAASLGASSTALNLILTGAVAVIVPLAWAAFAKAPPPIRPMCALLAPAATCWFVGTLVWGYHFIAGGRDTSPPLGPWDPIFVAAYVLALAAVLVGMRTVISLRHAALDASVIVAAGLALGAVGHGLENGISLDSLGTLVRPTLGIVMLTLIVSAGLGAWQGLPLSLVLFGVGQVCLTLGGLVYTFSVVEDGYVDLRWTGIGIVSGAAFSFVAAGVIAVGIDRPVKLVSESRIPNYAVGAKGFSTRPSAPSLPRSASPSTGTSRTTAPSSASVSSRAGGSEPRWRSGRGTRFASWSGPTSTSTMLTSLSSGPTTSSPRPTTSLRERTSRSEPSTRLSRTCS